MNRWREVVEYCTDLRFFLHDLNTYTANNNALAMFRLADPAKSFARFGLGGLCTQEFAGS